MIQSIEMCTSIQTARSLSDNKRRDSSVLIMPSLPIAAKQLRAAPVKRRRVSLQKSVHFNPQVNLRCVFPHHTQDQKSSWIQPSELRQMKDSARRLAKVWYISSLRNPQATAADEMNGDSLRGMEHITDFPRGKLRRAAKTAAIKSVNEEQCRQLRFQVLSRLTSSDAALSTLNVNEFKIDTAQLSTCYGRQTKTALDYARCLAEKDAREAAEILAQDL